MGKGAITGGGPDGLYQATLVHYRDRINAEITKLTALETKLGADIATLDGVIATKEAAVSSAKTALDTVIANWRAGLYGASVIQGFIPTEVPKEVEEAQKALFLANAERDAVKRLRAQVVAQKLACTKRKAALQAIPADADADVWCADLTEDLSGSVGTIEIPGEGTTTVIIQPGHEGAAVYQPVRDGQLQFRAGMSPEQAYFNAAILPGWQKFKPLHRIGTVTAIDINANTGAVDLDPAASSAQNLDINQTQSLSGVTFRYMTCNASAFAIGDRVVVEFTGQDWATAVVIGFESNPKPCEDAVTCAFIMRQSGTWTSNWFSFYPASFPAGILSASGSFPHVTPYDLGNQIGRFPFRGMARKDGQPYQQDLRDGYFVDGLGQSSFADTAKIVAISSHTGGGVFSESVTFGTSFRDFAYSAAAERWLTVSDDGGGSWTIRAYDVGSTTIPAATTGLTDLDRVIEIDAGEAGFAVVVQHGGEAPSGGSILLYNPAGTLLADERYPPTVQGFVDVSVTAEGFCAISWEDLDAYIHVFDTAGVLQAKFLAPVPFGFQPSRIARRRNRVFGMMYSANTPSWDDLYVHEYSISAQGFVGTHANLSGVGGYDLVMDGSNEMR